MNTEIAITEQKVLSDAYKTGFRTTFSVFEPQIDAYVTKPGCVDCKSQLLSAIITRPDLLSAYYGDDVIFDILPPERGPAPSDFMTLPSSEKFQVINCHVNELHGRLNSLASQTGNKFRMVGQARWSDQITIIIENI